MKKTLMILVVLACGWLMASCGGGGITVAVVIDPPAWEMGINDTKQFTAYSTGLLDDSVTWSVQEVGGGTITTGGLYQAPTTAGTYHVVATSNEDSSVSKSAAVVVWDD